MAHRTDRRAMLLAAGSVAFAAATGAGAAQSSEIRGTVEYEGGDAIPKGRLKVFLREEGSEPSAQEQAVRAEIQSDGAAAAINFAFPSPGALRGSSTPQIIATLERADGWLLARGTAVYEAGSTVRIVLYTAMY